MGGEDYQILVQVDVMPVPFLPTYTFVECFSPFTGVEREGERECLTLVYSGVTSVHNYPSWHAQTVKREFHTHDGWL